LQSFCINRALFAANHFAANLFTHPVFIPPPDLIFLSISLPPPALLLSLLALQLPTVSQLPFASQLPVALQLPVVLQLILAF
jgi:hypothetical protein